jgi:hypothetical protein
MWRKAQEGTLATELKVTPPSVGSTGITLVLGDTFYCVLALGQLRM